MILDDLLIALIIAGIGISGAYLRAELLLHRRLTAVQQIRQLQQRQLHTTRAQIRHNGVPVSSRDSGLLDNPQRSRSATRKIPTCEPPAAPWPEAIVYFQRLKPQEKEARS